MRDPASESPTLSTYLRVLRRRKWIVLTAIVVLPAAAYAFSTQQPSKFQASAEVLLSRQNLSNSLNGVQDPTLSIQPDRLAQTQADLARVPPVIQQTLNAANVDGMTVAQFSADSSVSAKTDADLLTFRFTHHDPQLAALLATEYARQYIAYRTQLDTQALSKARRQVQDRIDQLESSGDTKSALYASLVERDQQLQTMQALQTSNASLVREAQGASQVQPRPARNAILGLMLGVVLGVGLAFLREALDTRVRSADEVAERLGVPLLGRVPAPPRSIRARDRLVMVEEPAAVTSEPFRVLRTSLDFANLDRGAKSIMVTSALSGEGKSTTAANLAVALVQAGRHVALVDLDLRRPYIDRFFALNGHAGLTAVALGTVDLDAALESVPIGVPVRSRRASTNGALEVGRLDVLKAGILPPNPGEFASSSAIGRMLHDLRDRADIVLVDAPPIVGLNDALALSARVDALLLVVRLRMLRRSTLNELRRVLDAAPVPALGFVLTESDADEGYGGGYAYAYYGRDGESARRHADRPPRRSTATTPP